jgi:hypothetical protein
MDFPAEQDVQLNSTRVATSWFDNTMSPVRQLAWLPSRYLHGKIIFPGK